MTENKVKNELINGEFLFVRNNSRLYNTKAGISAGFCLFLTKIVPFIKNNISNQMQYASQHTRSVSVQVFEDISEQLCIDHEVYPHQMLAEIQGLYFDP